MIYIQLSPDMQLYIQAMQIKWSDSQRFQNLILRAGVMHLVQNVCGCFGHLMQGSGLETLIGSAFGGVSSIMGHGSHGCVRCAHSGLFIPFSYNPSCRLASRRGRRYVNTWSTALPNWSPLGRQHYNPNLARIPVAPLRER